MKKKLSVVLLLFFSFSLFAAPGGDRGGPGGSRGGPGSNPGREPVDASRPERSARVNPPSRTPASSIDGHSDNNKHGEKKSDNITNFRGVKLELSEAEPKVVKSSVSETVDGKKKVVLYFNQTINSKNFVPEKILINGKTLGDSTKIKFNKRSDSCSFLVEKEEINNIEITELEGYNGKKTESVRVKP